MGMKGKVILNLIGDLFGCDGWSFACPGLPALQVVQICAEHKKPRKLLRHVQEIYSSATGRNPPRVLVFANRVKTVRFVYKLLKDSNMRVAMLHGERSQQEREVRPSSSFDLVMLSRPTQCRG